MKITKKSLRLQGIIYGDMNREEQLVDSVEKASKNGLTLIRFYKGRLADSAFKRLYSKISEIADKRGIPVIIGDNAADAISFNADGVHVEFSGSEELSNIRKAVQGKLLGATVKTSEEAALAQDAGADYVELARVFNTDGKRETRLLNLSLLKEICACVSIPVIASGGITEENMEMLAGIGVDGVASIHSVFFRRDTAAATALVRRSVDDVVLPQSGIQGAIFDMDGTLIDSMAIWEELGERYIRNKNMTPKPDLNEAVKHLSLSQASSYLKHEYNIDLPQEEIYHQLSRTVKIYYDSEAKLKEGALELLEKLKERKVPIALLTATDRGQTESILKRCGIYDFFDVILTVAEFGQSKAHTAIFKEVRHRLGTPVNTTWVFEDALYAAAAAKRAGFRVTAVYDESGRCDWDKIRRKADIAVESLADFPVERL